MSAGTAAEWAAVAHALSAAAVARPPACPWCGRPAPAWHEWCAGCAAAWHARWVAAGQPSTGLDYQGPR